MYNQQLFSSLSSSLTQNIRLHNFSKHRANCQQYNPSEFGLDSGKYLSTGLKSSMCSRASLNGTHNSNIL